MFYFSLYCLGFLEGLLPLNSDLLFLYYLFHLDIEVSYDISLLHTLLTKYFVTNLEEIRYLKRDRKNTGPGQQMDFDHIMNIGQNKSHWLKLFQLQRNTH